MNIRGAIIGFVLGVIVTIPAIFLAILSAGAGHGHYEFARLFYPYSMLLTRLFHGSIEAPSILLALAQFPIYGYFIGVSGGETSARRRWIVAAVLLFLHLIAVAACFFGAIPNFS